MVRERKQPLQNKCDRATPSQESRTFICSLGSFEQEAGPRVPPEPGRCNATIRIQKHDPLPPVEPPFIPDYPEPNMPQPNTPEITPVIEPGTMPEISPFIPPGREG